MTTNKNNQSTSKPIRFKNDLIKNIDLLRGDESFAAWVQDACKQKVLAEMTETLDASKDKLCRTCGTVKALTAFPKDKSRGNGRALKCRACLAEYDAKRHSKTKK